ncbi:nuclear transport factor 2 family protein [Nitrosomonas supralitoralis]|uniref:Nuclear transport factor 2 family protein n=1 Tax=Nitrosomonas supralitoralis TaxID=2116706 RepID=A0A2P7NXX7_9PROT|nr:nuclear transport factor 2 family protein [Nitrosomonas supralitoralis]PSJ18315.1 nuclear transport factor 2 family protein [Nitrosomonas supralitoralis]
MAIKQFIELTRKYVKLSNDHDLARIKCLFASDATYHSDYFGTYRGANAIHTMMTSFFARFPDAHWAVLEYRNIEQNGVEFAFTMTSTDISTSEPVTRFGLERIYFTSDGLIRNITVCKPEE